MNQKTYTYKEMQALWNLPLKDKITRTNQIILNVLKKSKKPLIACSWGKDSIVVTHLVLKWCENVTVLFNNTLVEYPQTYEYRDKILEEWNIKNYIETKPIKTFWQCVEDYGYPHFRSGKDHKKKGHTPKCCHYMKEKPAMNVIKQGKFDLEFMGLLAAESMNRRLLFLRLGEIYYSKTWGCIKCNPIFFWKESDVLGYIKRENIPMNEVYKTQKRNGCIPCTGFKGWEKVLAKTNPQIYKKISHDMGQSLITDCFKDRTAPF